MDGTPYPRSRPFTSSDRASLGRQREPCMRFVLRREVVERRLADVHHHLDDLAGEGKWRLVLIGHRRAGVAAHVEALVGRIEAADLFLEPAFTNRLLAESKCDRAASLELAWLVDLHFGGHDLSSRQDWVRRRHAETDLIVVVVFPVQFPVLHEERPAAAEPAAAGEHALSAGIGNHDFGGDRVMDVLRVRRRPLGHTDRSTWIEEVRLPTKMTG